MKCWQHGMTRLSLSLPLSHILLNLPFPNEPGSSELMCCGLACLRLDMVQPSGAATTTTKKERKRVANNFSPLSLSLSLFLSFFNKFFLGFVEEN